MLEKGCKRPRNEDDNSCFKLDEKYNLSVKDNRVIFHGSIDQKSCFDIIEALDKASDNVKKNDSYGSGKIMFYINSMGGCIYSAFSVVEHMRRNKYPITTVCEGCVASAAVLISLAGSERIIGKHSYMLIHEIRSSAWGKFSQLKDDMKNNKHLMRDMKKYMREKSKDKLPKEELDELLQHDILWDYKKCLKYGLVDSVE